MASPHNQAKAGFAPRHYISLVDLAQDCDLSPKDLTRALRRHGIEPRQLNGASDGPWFVTAQEAAAFREGIAPEHEGLPPGGNSTLEGRESMLAKDVLEILRGEYPASFGADKPLVCDIAYQLIGGGTAFDAEEIERALRLHNNSEPVLRAIANGEPTVSLDGRRAEDFSTNDRTLATTLLLLRGLDQLRAASRTTPKTF